MLWKKFIIVLLLCSLSLLDLSACGESGSTDSIEENAEEKVVGKPEGGMSQLEQIEEQVQGIWVCEYSDSDFTEVAEYSSEDPEYTFYVTALVPGTITIPQYEKYYFSAEEAKYISLDKDSTYAVGSE